MDKKDLIIIILPMAQTEMAIKSQGEEIDRFLNSFKALPMSLKYDIFVITDDSVTNIDVKVFFRQ